MIRHILFFCAFATLGLQAATATDPAFLARNKVPFSAEPFSITDVRLLDGPFRNAMLTNQAVLLALEPNRLLHTFRVTACLPSTAAPLGGWEEPGGELRGHSIGHYVSACALMYASTGNEEFKTRVNYIVGELAKCQAALQTNGSTPGFLSAYPESFFERVEQRKGVWAPYYTLHKIMAGFIDAYWYCGNTQALEVVMNMATWIKTRNDKLTVEQQQAMLGTEFGGMNEVLANLYAITGDPEHLRLAKIFDHKFVFDPLARGEDRLQGLHANTQIPKVIGAAREFELTGEPSYYVIASCFWSRVVYHRSYVIGGNSDREHFVDMKLSPATAECCNTYNMLKLARHLFALKPDAAVMDFYERALYNQILASQDPASGMFCYFMPLKPGLFKVYSTPNASFWCCQGTGMENHGRYGESIYFHSADTLYVNLFIASTVAWKDKGIELRQDTTFPELDTTAFRVSCAKPVAFSLNVRYPGWVQQGFSIALNGKPVEVREKPGSYVAIARTWTSGDVVTVRMPMALHTEVLQGTSNMLAIMCGPIVLSAPLGTEAIDPSKLFLHAQLDLQNVPTPTVPTFVCEPGTLLSHIVPIARQPLTYKTKNMGKPYDVPLIPYYRVQRQRETVYWEVLSPAEAKQREAERAAAEALRKAIEARTIDSVAPGEQQPETDHHLLASDNSRSGDYNGRKWRDADNGWFSYQLKVMPDRPMTLVCTYWGGESRRRSFDILVDNEKIATQPLHNDKPDAFFDVQYAIPETLTKGKQQITVKFQAQQESVAGGVFDVRMLKP